jgi:hypothetical protein
MLNVTCFDAPVGKQWGNEPERINFGTQPRQIHLFFSQHFIYVFHGRQAGPVMALISFGIEMNCVLHWLDYADCNTQPVQTAITKNRNFAASRRP